MSLVAFITGCSNPGERGGALTTSPTPPGKHRWERIVVIGDSHAESETAWPSRLDCAPVEMFAVSGAALDHETLYPPLVDRIEGISHFLEPTDLVIVSIGSNDLTDWTDEDMLAAYTEVQRPIAASGATQWWTTIPPLSPDWPISKMYDEAVDTRARWNDFILSTPDALDLAEPLGEMLDPDEELPDHVHLSRSAEDRVSEVAVREICGD